MITPEQIKQKCQPAYCRYVKAWVQGEIADFFPFRIRANKEPIKNDLAATQRAVTALREGSKESKGWGYTVHWKEKKSPHFGKNLFPTRITIDSEDDLLRLAGKRVEFASTCRVVHRVREAFPELSNWLVASHRTLASLEEQVEGLIAVTRFFLEHPWPDCYARQVPASVDTKFIERHKATLRQWLDELLPAEAIRADETDFFRRFGLRDGQPHRAIRILDPELQGELQLSFDELSLPLRHLSQLDVQDATVFIVENGVNLLTLPPYPRGVGIWGVGDAVVRLQDVSWLAKNRIIYWGDIDTAGFHILSRLRMLYPQVQSIMMDLPTLQMFKDAVGQGAGNLVSEPSNLTEGELAAFRECLRHNLRLEQEHIPQDAVEKAFTRLSCRHSVQAATGS